MLWDKERTEWITDVDKKKICPQGVCCLSLYPLLPSYYFGLFRCNPFSIVSVEVLTGDSKLSCHRQLCYKRLALSLPLQYFPCFCEKTPTLVSAVEIDSERAIKKKKWPALRLWQVCHSVCLHSVFEKPTVFVWNFILWKHTTDNYQ